MTNVVLLGLNRVGERIYNWLLDAPETTVMAVITDESQYETIKQLEPDLLVSAGFRHIVPDDVLAVPEKGAVNIHKSYLPYNKGTNPNVWSIIEDAPAGVSIHYMTDTLDEGPLIARRGVPIDPDDTGKSLYRRLERYQLELFKQSWEAIRTDTVDHIDTDTTDSSYHTTSDFTDLFELDRDETVRVGEFIDQLRALTFPPYNNAYFETGDERYYVEIDITPASEAERTDGIHWTVPKYED